MTTLADVRSQLLELICPRLSRPRPQQQQQQQEEEEEAAAAAEQDWDEHQALVALAESWDLKGWEEGRDFNDVCFFRVRQVKSSGTLSSAYDHVPNL